MGGQLERVSASVPGLAQLFFSSDPRPPGWRPQNSTGMGETKALASGAIRKAPAPGSSADRMRGFGPRPPTATADAGCWDAGDDARLEQGRARGN